MPFGSKTTSKPERSRSFIAAKLSQLQESARKKLTERELKHINEKVGKLLTKIDDNEQEQSTSQTDQCLKCRNARATMQTMPCGHCTYCRRCFVRAIQEAVLKRALPLRCMLCQQRVLNLSQSLPTNRPLPRLPQSVSQYSMASSEGSASVCCDDSHSSSSLHSVGSAHSRGSSLSQSSARSTGSSKSGKKRVSFSPTPEQHSVLHAQSDRTASEPDQAASCGRSPMMRRLHSSRSSVGSKVSLYSDTRLSPIRESRSERSSSRNGSSTSSSRCSSSLSSSHSWKNTNRLLLAWKSAAPLADDETKSLLEAGDDES